jgi:hypothetical protein
MRNFRRLPSPALAVAILALVLALSGSAVAAKRYLITNTKQISPAALKQLAKLAAREGATGPAGAPGATGAAGASGTAGTPGKEGAAGKEGEAGREGAAGKEGAIGPAGPPANISWAVVEPNGVVVRASESNVAAREVTPGFTVVEFKNLENVTDCAYEATVGLASQTATPFPGFASVVREFEHENAVYVETFNEKGVSAAVGFHLAVLC